MPRIRRKRKRRKGLCHHGSQVRRLDSCVTIPTTKAQRSLVKLAARCRGMSMSAYCRELIVKDTRRLLGLAELKATDEPPGEPESQ
jgi:hypothetical protein